MSTHLRPIEMTSSCTSSTVGPQWRRRRRRETWSLPQLLRVMALLLVSAIAAGELPLFQGSNVCRDRWRFASAPLSVVAAASQNCVSNPPNFKPRIDALEGTAKPLQWVDGIWTEQSGPGDRWGHSVSNLKNDSSRLWMFGGATIMTVSPYRHVVGDLWLYSLRNGSWKCIDSSPERSRAFHTSVICEQDVDKEEDYLLIFGGGGAGVAGNYSQAAVYGDTLKFGITSEKWYPLAPSPHPLPREAHTARLTPTSDSWVLFGGMTYSNCLPSQTVCYPTSHASILPLDDLWVFDLETDTWQEVQQMLHPSRRFSQAATNLGTKFVVCGGSNITDVIDKPVSNTPLIEPIVWTVDMRDVVKAAATNGTVAWEKIPFDPEFLPLSVSMEATAVSRSSETFVLIGGRSSETVVRSTLSVFNTTSAQWSTLPSSSSQMQASARSFVAAGTVSNYLLLHGGFNLINHYGDMHMYDPANDLWFEMTQRTRPSGRGAYCSAQIGNVVYLYSGYDSELALADFWTLDLHTGEYTLIDGDVAPGPRLYCSMTASVAEKRIYLFGGTGITNIFGDVWVYMVESNVWRKITNIQPRFGAGVQWIPETLPEHAKLLIGEMAALGERDDGACFLNCKQPPENGLDKLADFKNGTGSLLLFGGTSIVSKYAALKTVQALHDDTLLYDIASGTWYNLTETCKKSMVKGYPSPRYSHVMIAPKSPARPASVGIVYGGFTVPGLPPGTPFIPLNDIAIINDLWLFRGVDTGNVEWVQVDAPHNGTSANFTKPYPEDTALGAMASLPTAFLAPNTTVDSSISPAVVSSASKRCAVRGLMHGGTYSIPDFTYTVQPSASMWGFEIDMSSTSFCEKKKKEKSATREAEEGWAADGVVGNASWVKIHASHNARYMHHIFYSDNQQVKVVGGAIGQKIAVYPFFVSNLTMACNSGYFTTSFDDMGCIPCPLGQYNPDDGSNFCLSCPADTTTAQPGAASLLECNVCERNTCKQGTCQVTPSLAIRCNCNWGWIGERCSTNLTVIIAMSGVSSIITIAFFVVFFKCTKKKYESLRQHAEETEQLLHWTSQELASFEDAMEVQASELEYDRLLDSGAFGDVWVGRFSDQIVAIKKLKGHLLELDDGSKDEFAREVQLMRLLRHPNIVYFYGAGCEGDVPFLVVEFMYHGSLGHILADEDVALDWGLRLRMLLDTAQGMNYLHTRSPPRIHRDLKSANLLVSRHWVVKVSDFGTSRLIKTSKALPQAPTPRPLTAATLARSGSVNAPDHDRRRTAALTSHIGTFLWCAPEVLDDKEYFLSADVYSFAIVMWEIAERRLPYEDMPDLWGIRTFVLEGKRPSLVSSASGLPERFVAGFNALMVEAWDGDPDKRPTFEQIRRSLEGMCNALPCKFVPLLLPKHPNLGRLHISMGSSSSNA